MFEMAGFDSDLFHGVGSMQVRFPEGMALDDLDVGQNYQFVMREPRYAAFRGLFVRLILRRGQCPQIVIAVVGGWQKQLWVNQIASIERFDAMQDYGHHEGRGYGEDEYDV